MQKQGNVTGSAFSHNNGVPLLPYSYEESSTPNNRVLIVCRELDNSFLLKTFLGIWGYESAAADSIEQALSGIEREPPGLILLDSVLPFEQHLENIRRLRRHEISRALPLIVISGYSQPPFKRRSMEVGADGFFVKPLDFDQLHNFVAGRIGHPVL